MKKLLLASLVGILTGCATVPSGPVIDHSLVSKGQNSRVRFIVIHYTVSDLQRSIMLLTEKEVSAHYLLTDEQTPKMYGLVDEKNSAWHAGVSSWKSYSNLNNSSIGIEIVNPGFTETPDGKRTYFPFPQSQMDQLIPLLKDLVARHKVAPENILGHSDIAPQRKQDPGPLFPWKQLADAGLIQWPAADAVAAAKAQFENNVPDAAWFQKKLAQHGYAVPQTGVMDKATYNVLVAFQTKYRQSNYDGVPDAESAAILEVLTAPQPKPAAAVAGTVPPKS